MNTSTVAIAAVWGGLANAAFASVADAAIQEVQEAPVEAEDGHGRRGVADASLSVLVLSSEAGDAAPDRVSVASSFPANISTPSHPGDRLNTAQFFHYRASLPKKMGASLRVQALSSSAASVSFIQDRTGIDMRNLLSSDRWMQSGNGVAQTLAFDHAWRDLSFEGAALFGESDKNAPAQQNPLRIDSRSARLSFSPAPRWRVRLSRGTVSGLDRLVVGDEVRRTSLSATYQDFFIGGDWKTTFAAGRNARKFGESAGGYLAESSLRFNGVHTLFGRMERVGSDEIQRENDALQRQLFKLNKLTLGYSQDLRLTPTLRLDAGAFATRYFVPVSMTPSYGAAPTAYMMFLRVKLQ